jgi:heavy metal sensor kinase
MRRLRHLLYLAPFGIRVQLTLWYTSISALLLLLFGVAFYTTLQISLASGFDTTLQMRSQQIAEAVSLKNGKLVADDMVNELPELSATAALVDSFDGTDASAHPNQQDTPVNMKTHIFVRIFDVAGKMVYSSPGFSGIVMPEESITQPLKRMPWYGTMHGLDDVEIRVYSTMLIDKQQLVGVVQVGQSLRTLQDHMEHIFIALLIITPFVLFCSALGCYWLAGRAFRPIHHLTRTAREISAKDLHQRVPVPSARDEVRDLSLIFNQMIGRLDSAFSQQRRFVADASHELRTPVAAIRSMTEVALVQPTTNDDYIAVLQGVNAESERLGTLISDLLLMARADEGQIQFEHDLVRLDLLVIDAVASLEPLAAEHKIALTLQLSCEATVLGDAARLIQVIISLIDNALTYTNVGGRVTLSVTTAKSFVLLKVSDTGIGISQQDKEHIFERFYRADPARSRAAGGSGLGLSIVDWIVRMHGGAVSVESQLGHGSTFTVSLPLVEPSL